jgi:tRNA-specific 2-thiouridylase
VAQARQVAAILGIPFYVIDSRDVFYSRIVGMFLEGHRVGITPNPCLACNQFIRWGFLLEYAKAMGASYLATGHYARLQKTSDGKIELLRGIDLEKDQSYVLSRLNQEQLSQTFLPLGNLEKKQVRAHASSIRLPVAERKDSQDLCFLGGANYRDFLKRHAPDLLQPGPILSSQGERLGTHEGLAFFTIGQRRGLGISGGKPLFVLEKDVSRNALIVGGEEELGRKELIAGQMNWISGTAPGKVFRGQVKIRYKARSVNATIFLIDHQKTRIKFDVALRDITPGQVAVIYNDDMVVGSGIIETSREAL